MGSKNSINMPHIIYSSHAERDLDEIWHYIAHDNLIHAKRWVNNIKKTLSRIAYFPGLGIAYPELDPEIRCLQSGNYLILYKAIHNGIKIYRIIHAARDLKQAWNV